MPNHKLIQVMVIFARASAGLIPLIIKQIE